MLSRTDNSGKPTSTVLGIEAGELSTSTSTGTASMPTRANVLSLANTGEHSRGSKTRFRKTPVQRRRSAKPIPPMVFARDGTLVASVAQEGLLRERRLEPVSERLSQYCCPDLPSG